MDDQYVVAYDTDHGGIRERLLAGIHEKISPPPPAGGAPPPYRYELDVPCDDAVDAKVFVIDDLTHSTMLLAEEY